MKNKTDITRKIKALLSLTTENGASEHEAMSALAKAQELMRDYYISQRDLEADNDRFVFGMKYQKRSIYPFFGFENNLARLFCCEAITQTSVLSPHIIFFGEQYNVDICMYFYEFIIKSCKYEIQVYKKTDAFTSVKKDYNVHGKLVIKSFVIGFMNGIADKLAVMNRNNIYASGAGYGIMILNKQSEVMIKLKETVNIAYNNRKRKDTVILDALDRGTKKAAQTPLNQGIKAKEKSVTLQLEM